MLFKNTTYLLQYKIAQICFLKLLLVQMAKPLFESFDFLLCKKHTLPMVNLLEVWPKKVVETVKIFHQGFVNL